MKILNKIRCGSSVFFDKFNDYKIKDLDWLVFVDHVPGNWKTVRVKIGEDDLIMFKHDMSKQEHIDTILETKVPMKIGKFLIPEFNKIIGFSVEDLKKLDNIVNNLDDSHKYQKIIYDSYIENNDFYLTEEQLNKAYIEYKKYRNYE